MFPSTPMGGPTDSAGISPLGTSGASRIAAPMPQFKRKKKKFAAPTAKAMPPWMAKGPR